MERSRMVSPPIVCGVDGSEASRRALHEAARLADALQARLVVVTAWQPSTTMYDAYFPDPERAPKVVAAGVLDDALRAEFGDVRPEWVTARAESGHAGKVLVEASRDADLLVVGSRGLSELASPFLGSVSLYCTTQASCPVLVVRPEKKPGAHAETSDA
ncbi:universal stress protein [uncultured Leifsonia sp.]|uniref:universal stress protein n=1 Tax=Leifsonia sp. TaxID=1870902 RepID=UPI0028D7C7F8|nr:universal stress protein [uncultured Leifsonia sp.]